MRTTYANWIAALLVAATIVVALLAWIALPEGSGVPVNYLGLDGRLHTDPSRVSVWVIPFAALMVLMVLRVVQRRGVAPAAQAFEAILIGVTGILLLAEALMIGRALNPHFDVMGPVSVGVGVLLLALGNVMGKTRHNAVLGLRNGPTLADARVWDKTHRLLGWGWVLGGLVLISLAFVLSSEMALGLSIGACTALPAFAAIAWSYRLRGRA